MFLYIVVVLTVNFKSVKNIYDRPWINATNFSLFITEIIQMRTLKVSKSRKHFVVS